MSEDEKRIFDKKLERPLANNRFHHLSIVGITASLDGSEINLEIQLIEGQQVSARLLKRGAPKDLVVVETPKKKTGEMEISDDDFIEIMVGHKRESPH